MSTAYNSTTRYVFGDFDGLDPVVNNLTFEALRMIPPGAPVTFLGDIISSFSNTVVRPTFDRSLALIREVFETLSVPIPNRYRTIIDVWKRFIPDLKRLYHRYQFDIFRIDNTKRYEPKFSKLNQPYEYSRHVPVSGRVRIVLGNNDLHALVNLINPLTANTAKDLFVLTSDVKRYNKVSGEGTNTYNIDVLAANTIYAYFNLCRVAFYDEGVLYIHYGCNTGYVDNVSYIHLNGTPLCPRKVICGHEKMYGLVTYQGVLTCYFDMGHCTKYYNGYYTPTVTDMYLVVVNGEILTSNTQYMLREDMACNEVYVRDRHITGINIVGTYDMIYYVTYDSEGPAMASSDLDPRSDPRNNQSSEQGN